MVVDEEGNEAPEDGQADPFYAIDEATGAVVPYQQTTNPSLSGTVEFRGATVRTVYDLLLDSLASYSVDWASEITGIPAEKIKELAELYAEGPSSLALGWGGNDKIANADIAGHAAAVLVALTGNVGKPGTGVGVYVGGTYNCHTAALGEWALPEDMVAAENEMASYDMRTKESNAHVLIAAGDDLCQHYGNMNVSTAWANSLDFIVSIDPISLKAANGQTMFCLAQLVLKMTRNTAISKMVTTRFCFRKKSLILCSRRRQNYGFSAN